VAHAMYTKHVMRVHTLAEMQDYNEVINDQNFVVQQSIVTMLEQGHYKLAISYMTQHLEAAKQLVELDQLHDYSASTSSLPPCTTSLNKSQLYYDLGCAYIIFWLPFVWSKQQKRKVMLLQHVDYLQQNHH